MENLKIKLCNIKDCDDQTKRILKKLTLFQSYESRMFNVATEKYDDRHIIKIAIGYLDNKIIGWASDEGGKKHNKHWICCFVKQKYRRKGIGTILCKSLIKRKKYAFGKAWSIESKAFWNSIKNTNKYFSVIG